MTGLTLTEADRDLVRSLIIAEPELVLNDDDVMRRLIGDATPERNVVDLRDRLVQRLERRLERLSQTHQSVIAAAYENVAGTRELHDAVLALLEPAALHEYLNALLVHVPDSLGLEDARLCLEMDVDRPRPAPGFEAHRGRVLALPFGMVTDYMWPDHEARQAVVLREARYEAELLFGEASPVASEACLRLEVGDAGAMVVLGSADRRHFDPSQGVLLLEFFAGTIERQLANHLARASDG